MFLCYWIYHKINIYTNETSIKFLFYKGKKKCICLYFIIISEIK